MTFDDLRPFQLVIWDDESFQSGGLTNANVDTFKQVYDAGIPLYFIGDDLAFSNVNLDGPRPGHLARATPPRSRWQPGRQRHGDHRGRHAPGHQRTVRRCGELCIRA